MAGMNYWCPFQECVRLVRELSGRKELTAIRALLKGEKEIRLTYRSVQ